MSEQQPICPNCGSGLEPDKIQDTRAECVDCDYYWDWVEAHNGKYD